MYRGSRDLRPQWNGLVSHISTRGTLTTTQNGKNGKRFARRDDAPTGPRPFRQPNKSEFAAEVGLCRRGGAESAKLNVRSPGCTLLPGPAPGTAETVRGAPLLGRSLSRPRPTRSRWTGAQLEVRIQITQESPRIGAPSPKSSALVACFGWLNCVADRGHERLEYALKKRAARRARHDGVVVDALDVLTVAPAPDRFG